MNAQVQIIERDGQPEYAVVPIETYRRLLAGRGHSHQRSVADLLRLAGRKRVRRRDCGLPLIGQTVRRLR
jgi:hypothetical protein